MRPLPVETVPGMPSFVRGTAIVRGEPTPVVDLRDLLGDDVERPPARLVTVRVGAERRVGLLVDEVLGVRHRVTSSGEPVPPLLAEAAAGVVDELGRLDGQLLTILRAGSVLPEDAWARLSGAE